METLAEVLDRFTDKSNAEGCWLWTGDKLPYGHGRFRHKGERYFAHRVAFELATGIAPGRLFVCHHCDTPSCVNPAHLFLGTAKDNTQDALSKGRLAHQKVQRPEGYVPSKDRPLPKGIRKHGTGWQVFATRDGRYLSKSFPAYYSITQLKRERELLIARALLGIAETP